VRFRRSEIRGKLLGKEVSPEPLSRNSYYLWPADFPSEEIGRPEHTEKILERGLRAAERFDWRHDCPDRVANASEVDLLENARRDRPAIPLSELPMNDAAFKACVPARPMSGCARRRSPQMARLQ
jgi:hypothetical protein